MPDKPSARYAAGDPPPLKALHTFAVLMRGETYSDAAGRLGISVSAISHQMRALEQWFGRELVDRSTKKPKATQIGRTLVDGLAAPFERIEQVVHAIKSGNRDKTIVISAPAAFASFRLLPTLAEFWNDHPDIEIEFKFARFDDAIEPFDVDLAIRFLHEHPSADRLGQCGWCAVASPSYSRTIGEPSSPTDLRAGILLHESIYNFWPEVFAAAEVTKPRKAQYRAVGDAHHVLSTLLSGHGAALLPNELTAGLRRTGALVKLFDAPIEPDAGYFAIGTETGRSKPALKALVRWVSRTI